MPAGNNVDIFINGKTNFAAATQQTISGLKTINSTLEEVSGKLRGFKELFALAFGISVGRHLFEKVHEGLKELSDGFAEAKHQGASFSEAMAEGIDKLLGLKTAAENAAEFAKQMNEADKAISSISEKVLTLRGHTSSDFPGLRSHGGYDAVLKEIHDERLEIERGAAGNSADLAVINQMRADKAAGKEAGLEDAIWLAARGITPWNFQRRYTQMKTDAFGATSRIEDLDQQDRDLRAAATNAYNNQGWSDSISNAMPIINRRIATELNEASSAGGSFLSKIFGPVYGAVSRGAGSIELRKQISKVQSEITAAGQTNAGTVGAFNDRFRTTGVLAQNPLLQESQKQTQHLQELRDKLRDLTKQLSNVAAGLGVAGAK